MKESELRKIMKCGICSRPIGHTGLPLFWRVRAERFAIDLKAVRRQDGLAALLGDSLLAAVMGTDEDLAKPIGNAVEITVCEACASRPVSVYELGLRDEPDTAWGTPPPHAAASTP